MNNIIDELQEVIEMLESDYKLVKQQETKNYIKNLKSDLTEIIEKYINQ